MTTRSKISLAAAALLILLGVLLYQTWWKEPSYQGRSLSEWLARLDHAQPDQQIEVIAAIRRMGPSALPRLFEMLHARDSPGRQKLAEFLDQYSAFTLRPAEPAGRLRQRAFPGLAALLDQRPKLIARHLALELQQPSSAGDVAQFLVLTGTNALAYLLPALTNPAPDVRASAAMALSLPAEFSRLTNTAVLRTLAACGITRDSFRATTNAFQVAATPALEQCLADPDPSVRRAAINSFDRLGPVPTNAIPILITELSGPDAWNRRWSAQLIGQFGPAAAGALPALVRLAADPDESVRQAATNALKAIDYPGSQPSSR